MKVAHFVYCSTITWGLIFCEVLVVSSLLNSLFSIFVWVLDYAQEIWNVYFANISCLHFILGFLTLFSCALKRSDLKWKQMPWRKLGKCLFPSGNWTKSGYIWSSRYLLSLEAVLQYQIMRLGELKSLRVHFVMLSVSQNICIFVQILWPWVLAPVQAPFLCFTIILFILVRALTSITLILILPLLSSNVWCLEF